MFTSNAMAALEMGAMPYARGLIDHQYRNYLRADAMIAYRGEETAQQARMLTILSLYFSFSGGTEHGFMLAHFDKAKTLAEWLIARRGESLHFPPSDPRYGMIPGNDEGHGPGIADQINLHETATQTRYALTALAHSWQVTTLCTTTSTRIPSSTGIQPRPRRTGHLRS